MIFLRDVAQFFPFALRELFISREIPGDAKVQMAGAVTRGNWLLEENAGRRLELRLGKTGQQGF